MGFFDGDAHGDDFNSLNFKASLGKKYFCIDHGIEITSFISW
jgi:hypothetical protein